ncbi:MAG: plasmid mobilization relaxosome protein MobC [Bacillota bacterium]|nr:plasmid mobilization relaxosome protein MobC [Bacillota bacterium]
MKRSIKKQIWLSRDEAEMLKKKAKKACLSEAGLMRFLLKGYEPKEKPDEEFYCEMNRMTELAEAIERLSRRADRDDEIQMDLFREEIDRWHRFQADIEARFLTPDEAELKWR